MAIEQTQTPTHAGTAPKKGKLDSIAQEIADLEKQIATTKYNKSTQAAVGLMKAKLAQLRQKQVSRSKSTPGEGYAVRKTGDGTVVLLGFPSTGKSTLLNALTNAKSAVAAYSFTTLTVIPGLLTYKHAKIQILDVPGIINGAASGSGRGKEVLQVIRTSDLVLMIIDVFNPEQYQYLLHEIDLTGVRVNKEKPNVKVTKTSKNGIRVGATVPLTQITKKEIQDICKVFRIMNAEILIRSDINADDFIDVLEANKVYLPMIKVLNKIDIADPASLERAREMVKPDLEISGHARLNIDKLKDLIFERMNFMRIYLKQVGKPADMEVPMIMVKHSTIGNLCQKLHQDFLKKFTFARIWGPSAKFGGQKILKPEHVMQDQDIVEIHMK